MLTRTDYDHLSKLGLPRTEENAIMSRKAFDPVEALKAFRRNQECELAVTQHKGLLILLAQYGITTKKDLERLLIDAAAAGLVSTWD